MTSDVGLGYAVLITSRPFSMEDYSTRTNWQCVGHFTRLFHVHHVLKKKKKIASLLAGAPSLCCEGKLKWYCSRALLSRSAILCIPGRKHLVKTTSYRNPFPHCVACLKSNKRIEKKKKKFKNNRKKGTNWSQGEIVLQLKHFDLKKKWDWESQVFQFAVNVHFLLLFYFFIIIIFSYS